MPWHCAAYRAARHSMAGLQQWPVCSSCCNAAAHMKQSDNIGVRRRTEKLVGWAHAAPAAHSLDNHNAASGTSSITIETLVHAQRVVRAFNVGA